MNRKENNNQRTLALKKILDNYIQETKSILNNDPNYFKRFLKEKKNLIKILRSVDENVTEEEIANLLSRISKK